MNYGKKESRLRQCDPLGSVLLGTLGSCVILRLIGLCNLSYDLIACSEFWTNQKAEQVNICVYISFLQHYKSNK